LRIWTYLTLAVKCHRHVLVAALLSAVALVPEQPLAAEPPALVGGTVQRGDNLVIAGPQGARYQVPGGGEVTLSAGTKALVVQVPHKLTIGPGQHPWVYSVFLTEGRADVDMGPRKTHSAVFITSSHGLKAIVAQGKLSAVVRGDEASVVNLGGQVLTAVKNRWRGLAPHTVWSIRHRSSKPEVFPLPGPPRELHADTVLAAPAGKAALPRLEWSRVDGAASYEVRVVRANKVTPVVTVTTTATYLERQASRLSPGHYQVFVTSMDRRGFRGTSSAPLDLTVVGLVLPDGAFVTDDGSVQLGRGQNVRFAHASELRLSYSGSLGSLSGAEAVGLGRKSERVVLLRRPGTSDGAMFRLCRRQLRAEVVAGPKRLIWPGPAAKIEFELSNGTRPVPDWVEPQVTVTVNLKPIEASWTKTGSTWRTSVRPRRGGGPWVLRVEVTDQYGIPLGEDFLEIVGRKGPGGSFRSRSARGS
jgi:hypothetical protein